MHWLLPSGQTVLQILLRTLVVYVVVLIGVRLTGKREIGQFTPFDLVLILLIANAVQNAMVGADSTLLGGLTAALMLFAVNWVVARTVERDRRARKWIIGEPALLVRDGVVDEEQMRKQDVTSEELDAALHEHGVESAKDVQLAMLEIDGTISVVPCDSKVYHSPRRVRQLRHGL